MANGKYPAGGNQFQKPSTANVTAGVNKNYSGLPAAVQSGADCITSGIITGKNAVNEPNKADAKAGPSY